MAQHAPQLVTPEEYLAREEKAEHKSEYRNGEIVALAGGSANHNQIAVNITTSLAQQLKPKGCRVFTSDLRLHIAKRGLYTYPDVMIICGRLEFVPGRNDTVTNPIVIFEVLSQSTEVYDRTLKFAMYRQIPSLQDYVLIDQTKPYIDYFRREGHFWVLEALERIDTTLTLRSLDVSIPLETIYSQVECQDTKSNLGSEME